MNDEELRLQLERVARRLTKGDVSEVVAGALSDAKDEARAILKQMFLRSILTGAAGNGGGLEAAERSVPEVGEPQGRPPGDSGVYVYCVTSAEGPPPDLPGVDPDARVEEVSHDGLTALVSDVPLSEFEGDALRDNLNDLQWLETKAQAHQRVQQAAVERAAMVPLRFCTIYRTRERVAEMLVQHELRLRAALAEVAGRTEWGVKLLYDPRDVARSLARTRQDLAPLVSDQEAAGEGTAYLTGKRLERATQDAVAERAHAAARRTHEGLATVAVATSVGGSQDKRLTKDDRAVALNAAYFVEDSRREEFFQAVEELGAEGRAEGFGVEVTGPWPPYSFVSLDLTAAGG